MSISSGRRIPKRSIIGMKVCVIGQDGIWVYGTLTSTRTGDGTLISSDKYYEVDTEESAGRFYKENEIYGPGFLNSLPKNTVLESGQQVYATHCGREVKGRVQSHDTSENCIEVYVESLGCIYKTLEDIRLMESRKSARLVNSDTDFLRFADVSVSQQRRIAASESQFSRRRLHSMSSVSELKVGMNSTPSIDVPSAASRKRRTSESRLEAESGYSSGGSSAGLSLSSSLLRSRDELNSLLKSRDEISSLLQSGELSRSLLHSREELRECTAAMVLMNLSASPSGERWAALRSPAEEELLEEEDEEPIRKHQRSSSTVLYKCTWRGCTHYTHEQGQMETHVREHLGRPEPQEDEERDFEEEFYYTELEDEEEIRTQEVNDIIDADIIIDNQSTYTDSQDFQPSYTDGQDYLFKGSQSTYVLGSSAPSSLGVAEYSRPRQISEHLDMVKCPPTSYYLVTDTQGEREQNPPAQIKYKKLVSIYPKPDVTKPSKPFIFQPSTSAGVKSDRKCRKIYGLEQKEQWCTQCRWKKACARFS